MNRGDINLRVQVLDRLQNAMAYPSRYEHGGDCGETYLTWARCEQARYKESVNIEVGRRITGVKQNGFTLPSRTDVIAYYVSAVVCAGG